MSLGSPDLRSTSQCHMHVLMNNTKSTKYIYDKIPVGGVMFNKHLFVKAMLLSSQTVFLLLQGTSL